MMQLANEMEFDKREDVAHILGRLIELSLWGNKADLSQLETSNKRRDDNQTIVDDSKRLIEYLEKGVHRIDIVLDNSGLELFTDILFASWMISMGLSEKIVLHAKAYPTFVSDATAKDVENLSKSLTNQLEFSELFLKYQEHGQIQILEHEFWNSPLHFFEMPEEMHDELKHSELIVFKGDANYRRIFGDRHIPTSISLNLLADYLPARSIAIRILKSEIMVGLTDLQFQELNQNHSDWMISGKFGIVQLLN